MHFTFYYIRCGVKKNAKRIEHSRVVQMEQHNLPFVTVHRKEKKMRSGTKRGAKNSQVANSRALSANGKRYSYCMRSRLCHLRFECRTEADVISCTAGASLLIHCSPANES